MKKLTCLLVMLLLGSGLTKAFIWDDVNGYPGFTLWNVSEQFGTDLLNLHPEQNYQMYIYFTCKHDITSLYFDLDIIIKGVPTPLLQDINCARGYGINLPKRVNDYITFKLDFNIPPVLAELPDSLFVLTATFTNQDSKCVAAGKVPVCITKKK